MRQLASRSRLAVLAAPRPGTGPTFPAGEARQGRTASTSTGVPVLTVRGKPAEMGEQFGVLAVEERPGPRRAARRSFLEDAEIRGPLRRSSS